MINKHCVPLLGMILVMTVLASICVQAANPPICPHIINWNLDHEAWAQDAPWIKVILWSDVEKAKDVGAQVFYRPYQVPGNDDRICYNGVQHANDVLALLANIPTNKWPDAIGYMNEFNGDNTYTPAQFPAYYDTLRAGGYQGLIVYGSYGVGWPSEGAYALPVVQAAINKADAFETHEYFDLTVAGNIYNLALRHVRQINENPYLLGKPLFIGEMGTTLLGTEDSCWRNGWKDTRNCGYAKFTAQQYIDQLAIYRAGCADQVVACFLFQQGDMNFADKDVMGTPVATWMQTTWTQTGGTLTGNVKNSSAQNLSGATVSTTTGGYVATTNSSGNYTISNVAAGTYSVVASKSGYGTVTQTGKTVSNGATTTVNFTLSPVTPGAIVGNVKDSSGVNLSGATVSTTTGGYSATTNSSGNYTISSVSPGTYSVVASKSGYVNQTQTGKTVNSGATTTVNFTLGTQPFSGIANKNFEGGFFNDPDADHQTGNSWHRFVVSGTSKSAGEYNTYRSSHYSQKIYEYNWIAGIYQQAFNCTVGNNFTASAWVRGSDSNVKFWVGIDPTGGTDAGSANVQWSAEYGPGTTWTQVSKQVQATSSTITMFIKARNPYANLKYAYIDDADLVDNGAGTPPPTGVISGNVKNSSAQNISGATVSTTTGGYTTTTDASGNYTLSNVTAGTYSVVASKSGYNTSTQTGKTVTGGQTTTVNFTLTTAGGSIASESYDTLPSWTSTYDATWGSAATFSSVTGGQSGNCMQASRTSQGSSSKVKVYTVPQNTSITISIYMKCPSYANSYWMETAYRLGSNTAQNYDSDAASWTLIKKFSNSGTNGNGSVWTQYSATVNTGSNTQISIGYKHGSSGYTGPTCWWDTFLIQ